jgi:hypothetical protein
LLWLTASGRARQAVLHTKNLHKKKRDDDDARRQ